MRLHLSDGMSYDIVRGSSAMILSGEVCIGVDLDNEGFPQRTVCVDPHHVTRIEMLEKARRNSRGEEAA